MSVSEKREATEPAQVAPVEAHLAADLDEVRRRRPVHLSDRLQRFSARFTAFARSRWDPTSPTYGKTRRSMEEIVAVEGPGYSREDFALQAGAWTMANRMRAPARDVDGEYMESAEQKEKKRYQPKDWVALTADVKRAARMYGACMVGVTGIDPLWVYASDGEEQPIELPDGVTTAVVLAVEMDYQMIGSSPSATASAATGAGYSKMAYVTACTARFLETLGWRALPCGNDTVLSIPLAIDAGLGELGRNGLLITPEFGPRVRLCKVLTDAPLVADTPITFGVREFCDACMKCADECPSASISRDEPSWEGPTPSNNPGALKWYVNVDQCLAFWRANGTGCANCIRCCPFNKPQGRLHDLVRFFIGARSRWLNRVFVLGDGLAGYGRQRDPGSFWSRPPA
ncbi:MAG: reductive dehalogenase [Planctomycetes bacterium]|nr:reductive dehalogenase [Planctomycetota bacterium]